MRKVVTVLSVLFAVLLSGGLAAAQTKSRASKQKSSLASAAPATDAEVERIFERFIEAQGEPSAIRSVHSLVMRGIVEIPEYGMHGTVEVYAKEPNKKLTVLNLPGRLGQRLEAYNGRSGWGQMPFTRAFDLNRNADADEKDQEGGNSILLTKNYSKLSLKGKTSVGGREAVMIEGTFVGGQPLVLYFDIENGLLVRLDVARKAKAEETGPMTTYFEGFAKVKGVVLPTVIREIGREFSVVIRYYEVKFNVHIEDSLFDRPKSANTDAKDESEK